jgi:hypothetical protein
MDFLLGTIKQTISLLFSIGLIALLGFCCREYIKRYVDFIFKRKEIGLDFEKEKNKEVFRNALPMLREIGELVYRMRNYSRDILENNAPLSTSQVLYSDLCSILREKLFVYRAFLRKPLWEKVHQFKRTNQDILLLIDIGLREDQINQHSGKLSDILLASYKGKYESVDRLYQEISLDIQKEIGI